MSEVKSRPQRKPCSKCGVQDSADGFSWYAYTTMQGKASFRRHSSCKECSCRQRRNRYAKNPAKDLASSRDWKQRNPDWQMAYKDAHRGAYAAHEAKRRAAQLQRTPPWADLDAIQTFYDKASEARLTVDHVVPLQGELVSGLHVPYNLCLLSKSKNSSKKNRFMVA